MPKTIEAIYCFIMIDSDGDEGIPAASGVLNGHVTMFPMIGADEARVKSLLPRVQEISNASGKPFRLMKFSEGEDVTHTL